MIINMIASEGFWWFFGVVAVFESIFFILRRQQ